MKSRSKSYVSSSDNCGSFLSEVGTSSSLSSSSSPSSDDMVADALDLSIPRFSLSREAAGAPRSRSLLSTIAR
jgi:hypothetical protein